MKRPGLSLCLALIAGFLGCGGSTANLPTTGAAGPSLPLAIRRPEGGPRVFSGEEEVPPAVFPFEGAPGSVRVTLEVVPISNATPPPAPMVNDVLFRAVGRGRISVEFRRPSPGHHEGRVTIRCTSAGEESEAEFEPEIWLAHPSAIVTSEAIPAESAERAAEGREVVLARYVARNLPRDIRVTIKATFAKEPPPPRVKAGPRPPR